MTEQAIATIITSVVGGITTVFLAWIAFRQNQLKFQAETLAAKLKQVAEVAETTHKLVNSQMGIQLAMHEVTTKQLSLVDPTPETIAAAERARLAHAEHRAKQAEADARPK